MTVTVAMGLLLKIQKVIWIISQPARGNKVLRHDSSESDEDSESSRSSMPTSTYTDMLPVGIVTWTAAATTTTSDNNAINVNNGFPSASLSRSPCRSPLSSRSPSTRSPSYRSPSFRSQSCRSPSTSHSPEL